MAIQEFQFQAREKTSESPLVLGIVVPDSSRGYWTDFFSSAIEMDHKAHESPYLGKRNCELYVARTAKEGLELIGRYGPDLTIIDVCLKVGKDGVDQVLIPARKRGYRGRVICMGFTKEGDQVYSRRHGADEFVEETVFTQEPYKKSDFLQLAHMLLYDCPFTYTPRELEDAS